MMRTFALILFSFSALLWLACTVAWFFLRKGSPCLAVWFGWVVVSVMELGFAGLLFGHHLGLSWVRPTSKIVLLTALCVSFLPLVVAIVLRVIDRLRGED